MSYPTVAATSARVANVQREDPGSGSALGQRR